MKIKGMYFSPTGTTEKIIKKLTVELGNKFDLKDINNIDFTLPSTRLKNFSFSRDDILILGVPVYAGRVPNILLKFLNSIEGNGALAIPIVLYGNRNYDDALIELKDIMEEKNFKIVGAGAFIGEHSFSKILAENRPDSSDMEGVEKFAEKLKDNILNFENIESIFVKGNKPYRKYYMPKNKDNIGVDIRKVKPKTNGNCNDCKICVNVCPMGSIDFENPALINGICIKCGACIKKCPVEAKYYDDKDYLVHKEELEIQFATRREIEIFV